MTVIGRSVLPLLVYTLVSVTCIHALSAEIVNNGATEYTFLWFIENYSYCWHKNGEELRSPVFTTESLAGTSWYLMLHPRGEIDDYKGYASLFLMRNDDDDGPEDFLLKYELSILAANGSAPVSTKAEQTFERENGYGRGRFVHIDDVLLRSKTDFLPQDTLSIRCKMRIGEGSIQQVKQIVARTRIGVEHISFLHVVEDFSAILPNQNQTIEIRSPSKKGRALSSTLYFPGDTFCDGKIVVQLLPYDDNRILSRCKLSLLDVSGKVVECGDADNRFGATRKDIQKLPLTLTRQVIINRKNEYLPNDKLSLLWQGIFSTGVEYEKIESTLHGIPFDFSQHIHGDAQHKDKYNTAEMLPSCSGALDDFKAMYIKQRFTDVELKTKTRSFYVHKNVLCARSSVFNATITNNMASSVIQINDFDDEIVQQLLLFLYSDNVEDLEWESAIKLYHAADKYEIEKLKLMCSSFLVRNLTISSASQVLLLADNHKDSDLRLVVEGFIYKNEEQVFLSEEWGKLIEANPVLVSKTMRRKYMRRV